jgi:capsular polysaccharide biosynthesis protein
MEAISVELKEYLKIIRKRFLLIAAIVIVACVLTGIKSFFFTDPVYSATSKLIVSQSVDVNGKKELDYSSIQSDMMLINTYIEIIQSAAILDKVAANYPDLQLTSAQISGMLEVSAAKGSQVMDISATDLSNERAAKVVNAVAAVFKQEIPKILNVNNVTILTQADGESNAFPINRSPVVNILISFIVSLLLAVGLVFLLDYLDDTIKSEEDVEQTLGIPTLAQISKINRSELQPYKSRASDKQVGEGKYVSAK